MRHVLWDPFGYASLSLKKLCPEAIFPSRRPYILQQLVTRSLQIFIDIPLVEPISLDEAFWMSEGVSDFMELLLK
ncbi:MAG: hypothetical protein CM15mP49_01090 [Actinomycetota bacterium]|nr:MAG: hypothetical protein CM15mP49_01090 [Actinomycetota bacterium]